MLSSTLRRLAAPLLAAAVTALVLASAGGAIHAPGFGHVNTLTAGESTTVICNVADNCIYFGNDNADTFSAVGVAGSHDNVSGAAAGVVGTTISTSPLAEGVRGWTLGSPGAGAAGVRGISNGTGANGIGVWGSQNGSGI